MNDVELSNEIDRLWKCLLQIDWQIHEKYGQAYLSNEEFNAQMHNLSKLRKLKGISHQDRSVINTILRSGVKHRKELEEYLYNAPRREAQKFIGKKNIRNFIFKRDGYACLRCGSKHNLSLDHIVPIE